MPAMPDTYEDRVAQGESPEQARDEVCLNTLQQELGVSYHALVWSWKKDGFEPPTIAEWNKVCRAIRAAQAAQEDKEKLEQRVKELEARVHELEFEPLSMHRQFQAKQGEVDLWEKRYNEAIKYIEGVRDYLEKQHMEIAMREVFAQGLREMEENVSSAIALAIHLDHLITPKGESNGS
jgi:hypothetical protein